MKLAGKAGSLVAAICLTALLSGCGVRAVTPPPSSPPPAEPQQKTAYQWVTEVREKENRVQDLDAEYTIKMEMGDDSSSIAFGMNGNIRAKAREGQPEMLMDMTISILGQKQSMSLYYLDGQCYMDSNGMKFRTATPAQEVKSQFSTGLQSSFQENEIRSSEVRTEDGETVVSMVLDGKAFTDLVQQTMGNMMGGETEMNVSEMILFSDAEMELRVDAEGNPLSEKVALEARFDPDRLKGNEEAAGNGIFENLDGMTIRVTKEMSFRSFGQPVSIIPPADLDAYVDATGMTGVGGAL